MLQAGFAALRDRARPVKIQPRAFRLVCRNGSLVSNFEGEDVELEPEEVEAAIARCFDLDRFAAIVAGLREAAEFGLPDPRPMLNEMGYMRGRVESERRIIAIEDAWDEEGDPTYYGLMNAITAVARDLPDFRERLELEAAGSIAWLESLPRARRGVARARMEVLESV